MNLEIDFRSELPIYLQIVERVKEMIASGRLKPGDQLPTVRAQALDLRVNFNTVARAYRILDESGIISTQQGRGTYILALPPPETADKIRQQALQALTHRFLKEALRLGFDVENINQTLQSQVKYWEETGDLPEIEQD